MSAPPVVAVIGASQAQPADPDYQDGIRLGRQLAAAGCTLASGGYGGLMEAVSAGAAEAGGRVIGVTAPDVFPGRSGANQHVTEERPAATIAERIQDLLRISDAVIALPGSLGTLTELVLAWNIAYVAPLSAKPAQPIVAVGPMWGELVPFLAERLATNGDLVKCVPTVDEAVAVVLNRVNLRRVPDSRVRLHRHSTRAALSSSPLMKLPIHSGSPLGKHEANVAQTTTSARRGKHRAFFSRSGRSLGRLFHRRPHPCRTGHHRFALPTPVGGGIFRQTCSDCGAVSIDLREATAPTDPQLFTRQGELDTFSILRRQVFDHV